METSEKNSDTGKSETVKKGKNLMWPILMVILVIVIGMQAYYLCGFCQAMHRTSIYTGPAPCETHGMTNEINRILEDPMSRWGNESLEPLKDMERIRDHFEKVFADEMNRLRLWKAQDKELKSNLAPEIDLTEKKDAYVLELNMPGADKESITVKIDGQKLTVAAKMTETVKKEESDNNLIMERKVGEFERMLTLPGPVDAMKMTALCKNGVLTITAPKAKDAAASRTVPVQ